MLSDLSNEVAKMQSACVNFEKLSNFLSDDIVKRFLTWNTLLKSRGVENIKPGDSEEKIYAEVAKFMFTGLSKYYSEHFILSKTIFLGLNIKVESGKLLDLIYDKVASTVKNKLDTIIKEEEETEEEEEDEEAETDEPTLHIFSGFYNDQNMRDASFSN